MSNAQKKSIAQFMGATFKEYPTGKVDYSFDGKNYEHVKYLTYDESYDMLMPVVHKIYDITSEHDVAFSNNPIFEIGLGTPLQEIYEAVLKYIEWFESKNA